jgi:Flp pilus assembly protein TadG
VSTAARWRDERGLVGKAVVMLLVVILLLGVVAVEAGSIIFTKLALQNTASTVAADGARELASSHDQTDACNAVLESLKEHDSDAELKECTANTTTDVIFIKLRKVAPTLIVRRVSFLRKLGVVKATEQTGPGNE